MYFTYKSGLATESSEAPEVVLQSSSIPLEVNSKTQRDPNEGRNNFQYLKLGEESNLHSFFFCRKIKMNSQNLVPQERNILD